MIVIVDSGGANLVSIKSAFERLAKPAIVSSSIEDIKQASHLILPGVGSAETVMKRLYMLGLVQWLQTTCQPILGICVGMQILFDYSEEGATRGLGILPGTVKKLIPNSELTFPHMGWDTIKTCSTSVLMRGIPQDAFVYYAHNFAVSVTRDTVAETSYGSTFSAAVHNRNISGVQFHPERSGVIGRQLLNNFLEQPS